MYTWQNLCSLWREHPLRMDHGNSGPPEARDALFSENGLLQRKIFTSFATRFSSLPVGLPACHHVLCLLPCLLRRSSLSVRAAFCDSCFGELLYPRLLLVAMVMSAYVFCIGVSARHLVLYYVRMFCLVCFLRQLLYWGFTMFPVLTSVGFMV